jgi:hypothetical protein
MRRVHLIEVALRPSPRQELRRLAERAAQEMGLDPGEVLAEAERLLAWAADQGIHRTDELVACLAAEHGQDPAVWLAEAEQALALGRGRCRAWSTTRRLPHGASASGGRGGQS